MHKKSGCGSKLNPQMLINNMTTLEKWERRKSSPCIYQFFGSEPRLCSSLRIMRLIQAASDSSPSCCCASSINSRNSGSSLNWNGGLPRLSFLCVDTSITPDVMCLCVMTHYTQGIKIATPRSVCGTAEASDQSVI